MLQHKLPLDVRVFHLVVDMVPAQTDEIGQILAPQFLFVAGVFHVTASGFKPYCKLLTTCHVLSLPPLTGITQSYQCPALSILHDFMNARSRASQSICFFSA